MWDILDQLERTRRKEKKEAKSSKKCNGIVKCLLYWMCINFFRSHTTDIYSLRQQVLANYGKHITWPKSKDFLKINYTKNDNQITRILVDFGSLFLLSDSSTTSYRPITKPHGSASSRNILLAHRLRPIGRFWSCASFGFFQIGNLPFTKSPSLTRVKKRCQQMPPPSSFGVIYFLLRNYFDSWLLFCTNAPIRI